MQVPTGCVLDALVLSCLRFGAEGMCLSIWLVDQHSRMTSQVVTRSADRAPSFARNGYSG